MDGFAPGPLWGGLWRCWSRDGLRWHQLGSFSSSSFQVLIPSLYTPNPEKAMAPHSSTLAWKIPWTEEPGGLQSMGSLRVGHDWATSLFTFMHWRKKWQPTPVFLPGESQGRGAGWASVYGVAQSRTRLKWLSSSIPQTTGATASSEKQSNGKTLHFVLERC